MVFFVDRSTRLIVGIFVKNKNEDTAVEVMRKFIDTNLSAPKFSGKDFIFVQSDNGEMNSEKVIGCTHGRMVFFRDSAVPTIVYRMARWRELSRRSKMLEDALS